MNPDPNLALYAAMITLSGTVFVAAVVVPWTQARARRRERWETAVSELSALLDDELKVALDKFTHAAAIERGVIARLVGKRTPDEIQSITRDQWVARRDAVEALKGPMRRLVRLSDVLRTRKRRRVEWLRMYILVDDVRFKVSMMTGSPNFQVDETEIFYQQERELDEAIAALIDHLKPIRDLMRLSRPVLDPSARLVRRTLEPLLWPAVVLRGRIVKWLAAVELRQKERSMQTQGRRSSQKTN